MSTVPPWEIWGGAAGLARTWQWARVAGLFYLAFCAALLAGIASPLFSAPPEVTIPALERRSQGQATTILTREGLKVILLDGGRSDLFAAGTVIGQSLPPGKQVRAGRTVYLMICQGPAHATVPNVLSKDSQAALTVLDTMGLNGSVATTASSATTPFDAVIQQVPGPGLRVDYGSTVALVVSNGPPDSVDADPGSSTNQDSTTIINYVVPADNQANAPAGPAQQTTGYPTAAPDGAGPGRYGPAQTPESGEVRLPPTYLWLPPGGTRDAAPAPPPAAAPSDTAGGSTAGSSPGGGATGEGVAP